MHVVLTALVSHTFFCINGGVISTAYHIHIHVAIFTFENDCLSYVLHVKIVLGALKMPTLQVAVVMLLLFLVKDSEYVWACA